jgi:plastocyanin
MTHRGLSAAAAALALALAGCGQHTITSTVKAPSAPAGVITSGTVVAIHNGILAPRHLTVIVGHAIQWQNFDTVGRRLEAVSGATFHSGVFANGSVFRWTPQKPGKIRYRDALHPGLAGTIAVIQ